MTQDTRTLKTQIIAALDFLSLDNLRLLAEFVAFLRAKGDSSAVRKDMTEETREIVSEIQTRSARIFSPRLVHREHLVDLKKEIVEVTTNDGV
jgi:hypothetical protein